MLLVASSSLFAGETVRWSWTSGDGNISFYRYQLDGEDDDGWTVVDSSVTSVVLPREDSTLFVQASPDGVNWSASGIASFVVESEDTDSLLQDTETDHEDTNPPLEDTQSEPEESSVLLLEEELSSEAAAEESPLPEDRRKHNSLRVAISPYSLALYRFYNGYNTTSRRTKTNSVYGFSCNVEFDMPLSSWLSFYPELGCDLIIKKDTVIPGARLVQYYKAGAGVDFTFSITEKNSLYTGLFGGAMVHINNKKASLTPYFGARLGYDYSFNEHFSLGAVSRVTFALFIGRSSKLMDSMTILIDPVSVTLTYRF